MFNPYFEADHRFSEMLYSTRKNIVILDSLKRFNFNIGVYEGCFLLTKLRLRTALISIGRLSINL